MLTLLRSTLEGSNQIVSDQGVRKNLYQKVCLSSLLSARQGAMTILLTSPLFASQIVAAFPDGWLSSGQISREVSVMKKKYEKESMEND